MRAMSFRFRLGLGILLSSLLVLLVFSLLAWALLYRSGVQQVDQQLEALARPLLHGPRFEVGWAERETRQRQSFRGGFSFVLRVLDRRGQLLHASEGWPGGLNNALPCVFPPERGYGPPPHGRERGGGPPDFRGPQENQVPLTPARFASVRAGGTNWRVMAIAGRDACLLCAANLTGLHRTMARTAFLFALAAMPGLVLIVGAALLLSGRALRPLHRLAQTLEQVEAQGLDKRVHLPEAPPEVQRLGEVFNTTMERLERSFFQANRFSGDAAHELKTPLAILQGKVEAALRDSPEGSEAQESLSEMLEEIHRLKAIMEKLLLLSRADAGALPLHPVPLDMACLVREVAEDTQVLAPHLKIECRARASLPIVADQTLITQMVYNLASNAQKYNHPDGQVRFRLEHVEEKAILEVCNTGPAIPPHEREKVFQRFYRADKSRSRALGGTGLGLSLCREIARAHGGKILLDQSPDGMNRFTLYLPLAPKEGTS